MTSTRLALVVAGLALTLAAGCVAAAEPGPDASRAPRPVAGPESAATVAAPSAAPSAPSTGAPNGDTGEREWLDRRAAITAYEVLSGELDSLALAGGATRPTKILTDNAAGDYLDLLVWDLRTLHRNGLRVDRAPTWSVRAENDSSPHRIRLIACEDTSRVRLLDERDREVRKDRYRRFVQRLTATKVKGRWKITGISSTVVKSFAKQTACRL